MDMRGESCDKKENSDPRDASEQRATRDQEEHGGVYRLTLQVCVSLLTSQ